MCGIVGALSHSPVNQSLYDALSVLQHRGQDAAGIMTTDASGRLHLCKDNGLVRDVFTQDQMLRLQGNLGIGHVRYPTAGCSSSAEAQPFFVNSPYGIALAHNGNLVNAEQLRNEVVNEDLRHLNTNSDSEILLNVFAEELQKVGKGLDANKLFAAVTGVNRRCRGAYAVAVMIPNVGLLAFRDPNGIRPLVFGQRKQETGVDYMCASESVALDALGYSLTRDVAPGEAVFVDVAGRVHTRQCAEGSTFSPCIFELVYLARPDSIMDDISVYKARIRMGDKLGQKILREWPDHDIDTVIPIPDTSRTAAVQVAHHLDVKYREGFIKNRYIGRTFIMPGQQQRSKSVRQKLNAIDLEFRDKNVLLVDDSIVRGTTAQQIVQMARDAGARKVYFASAAPPVRYPNVYGIDMPSAPELIAYGRSDDEVGEILGADKIIYQNVDDLVDACHAGNPAIERFDTSVFDGKYVTGDLSSEYFQSLEDARSDSAKNETEQQSKAKPSVIELHNAR